VAKERFGLSPMTGVVICYEAGREGFSVYRVLSERGYRVLVVDSSSIEVKRQGRHLKTDGVDVTKLMNLLQRYMSGEAKALHVVRVPSVEEEDVRRLARERKLLQKDRRQLLNRMGSLLFSQGYREWPKTVRGWQRWHKEARLPLYALAELGRMIERLAQLEIQMKAVQRAQVAYVAAADTVMSHHLQALTKLRGIAEKGAWTLVTEVYGWRKFKNRREVAGCLGLTPTLYASGNKETEQGIMKTGNGRGRAMLVELSWEWLRFQPHSQLSQWFTTRFALGGKRLRRIGLVALARRLSIALWRYLEYGEIPPGAKLKTA
jgi:transposase